MDRELLMLKLRNAIADKEWATACANRETSMGGWTCDWYHEIRDAESEIFSIVAKLEAGKES